MPGSSAVDLARRICTGSTCRTNRGNVWLYRDGNHLTVRGARRLTPEFQRIVATRSRPASR